MKKKTVIILSAAIVGVLLLIGGGAFFFYSQKKEQKNRDLAIREAINQNYSEVVKVGKDTPLYKNTTRGYEKIGTIYKNTILFLKSRENRHVAEPYFQIEESEYYVSYEHVQPAKKEREANSYLPFAANVVVKKNGSYYQGKEKRMTFFEEKSYPLLKREENVYVISVLGDLYEIHSDDVAEVKNLDRDTSSYAQNIAVFQFPEIAETCNKSACVSYEQLEKILNVFQEQKKQSISPLVLTDFVGDKVNLSSASIVLLYDGEKTDKIVQLEKEYEFQLYATSSDLRFVERDEQVSKKSKLTSLPSYLITSKTTLGRVEEMLKGIKDQVTVVEEKKGIPVLNYHFFYDGEGGEQCNESICIDIKNFKQHLQFFKDQGYKTLKMQEFVDWYNGEIELPEKSVLITVDDGAMGTYNHLPRILEEYDMYATLFLITGWWTKDRYQSTHLELQSHGHDLHHNDYCAAGGQCGIKTGLLSEEELLADLRLSTETIGTSLAFCYPFYSYSNSVMSTVSKAGFQVAFAGGNTKAKRTSLRLALPRYVIYKNTSVDDLKKMVQ